MAFRPDDAAVAGDVRLDRCSLPFFQRPLDVDQGLLLRRARLAHDYHPQKRALQPGETLLCRTPQTDEVEARVAGATALSDASSEVQRKLKVVAGV